MLEALIRQAVQSLIQGQLILDSLIDLLPTLFLRLRKSKHVPLSP